MARIGFSSGFYSLPSVAVDAQRCVNMYPEIAGPDSRSQKWLVASPGTAIFCPGMPGGQGRGIFTFRGRTFAAVDTRFFEIFSNGTFNQLNTLLPITNDNLPVAMCGNGPQLAVVSGGNLYVLTLANNTFTQVTGQLNGPVLNIVSYGDGYFIAALANSNVFQISALLDGTSWPGLQADGVSTFPDFITSIAIEHRELIVQGPKQSQRYYDSGSPNIFDALPGGFTESGIVGTFAGAKLDNSWFYWGMDERGGPVAYRYGDPPQRVSHHGIEYLVQSFGTWSDVTCYAFQDGGHTFFHSYFPTANKSIRYDVATQEWHEVDFTDQQTGRRSAHRSMSHAYAFGKHLVMDWASGNVLEMSSQYLDDFGNLIHRLRRAPYVDTEGEWVFHTSLQIAMETGLGPQPPLSNPATAVLLPSDLGEVWQIVVNIAGTLDYMLGNGAPQTIIINDSTLASTSWQLSIVTVSGDKKLRVTPVTFQPAPSSILVGDSAGTQMATLTISNGKEIVGSLVSTARDPQCYIAWSDDNGHTFTHKRSVDCGQSGNYKKRAIIWRLGRSRGRVYQWSASDPIPWRLTDAYLNATPGFQKPTERLASQLRKGA